MNMKKVVCDKCDNTVYITQSEAQTGWIFQEPGWAFVECMNLCPQCHAKWLRNRKIQDEQFSKCPIPTDKEGGDIYGNE